MRIEDFTLCPRYSALVFENVTVQPSPLWLQYRLTAIGLNPINNIVDMTNFVMAELAQPMHAFDADLLKGDTIFVRPAKPGERFRALNDEEYTLEPSNLVIADAAGAIALAGVIGGGDSAIGERTTRVVLESANFQASSVRKTSSAIKLRTDASMRFEKAQDPVNTLRGLARAVELLRELSPGIRLVGGLADEKTDLTLPPPIELPLDWLERKLGRSIAPAEVRDILERLEFGVTEPKPRVFSVSVPSWRATKDIAIKDDLVEEVGRMVGYDSITPQPPLLPAAVPPANPERRFQHDVRNLFVDLGFTEVYNYSFISEEAALAFGFDPAGAGARDQSDRVRPGAAAQFAAARHLEEHHRERQAPRVVPAVRDRTGDPQALRRPARRSAAPGGCDLRPAGRRRSGAVRNQARGGVPAARRAGDRRRSGALRAPGAGGGNRLARRARGTDLRAASVARRDRTRRRTRSGSAAHRGAERNRSEVLAHPALSFERLRPLRDRRDARACRQAAIERGLASPGRCWNRSSSCGSTPGRRSRQAARASPSG